MLVNLNLLTEMTTEETLEALLRTNQRKKEMAKQRELKRKQ